MAKRKKKKKAQEVEFEARTVTTKPVIYKTREPKNQARHPAMENSNSSTHWKRNSKQKDDY